MQSSSRAADRCDRECAEGGEAYIMVLYKRVCVASGGGVCAGIHELADQSCCPVFVLRHV
jgi:hypothetical protein